MTALSERLAGAAVFRFRNVDVSV